MMKMHDFEINQLKKTVFFLDTISHRLIEDMKKITLGEDYGLYDLYYKNDIEYYEFKLFVPSYRIDFFPMSSNSYQLGIKKILQEYPNGFMEDVGLYIDNDYYHFDDAGLKSYDNYYDQVEEKIYDWFNRCWIKAGGLEITGNYTVSVYDSNRVFDLVNQVWIDKPRP